ncbi:Rod binding protein [Citreimonas salinaria]|uniref:Rod binding protein n=1 Tax=Citreimonas salinaria TaxID=321339 RepID=A0A1H3EXD5_9RHOB|nr:Rod binding protein [Citreimonas salinaria]
MQVLPPPSALSGQTQEQALRAVAEKLEATFLSEMLKSAGLGKTPEGFGGGSGEDQFSSFLREEHANAVAARGGIGLAESLFNALKGDAHG